MNPLDALKLMRWKDSATTTFNYCILIPQIFPKLASGESNGMVPRVGHTFLLQNFVKIHVILGKN